MSMRLSVAVWWHLRLRPAEGRGDGSATVFRYAFDAFSGA
jgi:hypothetical protein